MKIPTSYRSIKRSAWALAFYLAGAPIAFSGCAPAVLFGGELGAGSTLAPAPFSARGGTTSPGSLLGPFDGRVTDGASGRPIAAALVYASWAYERGDAPSTPDGAFVATALTDADGGYRIPKLPAPPRAPARVARFTLIVYKRGFIGYRSDRRFGGAARHDFSQSDNTVRLQPFGPSTSHLAHLLFLGGGRAIREASAGERMQAALAIAGAEPPRPPVAGEPLLDASTLLSADELKATTGYAGAFKVDRLGDLPRSTTYDSLHFRAVDRPESYDAALRVWVLPSSAEAEDQYTQLIAKIPGAERRDEVGDRSVAGRDGSILAVATLVRAQHAVVEVTCGTDLCHDRPALVTLTRRALSHLPSPANAATPVATRSSRAARPLHLTPPELRP